MIDIFSLSNGIKLVGWLLVLFMFWRVNKREYLAEQLYKVISFMFIGGIAGHLVGILGRCPTIFPVIIGWIIIVILWTKQQKTDPWPILDSLCIPVLMYIIFYLVIEMVAGINPVVIGALFVVLLYLVIVLPWSKNNYRVLTWYPSGKNGFIFLLMMVYLLFVSLLVAFWYNPTLYLQKLILFISLVVTIMLLYYRSSRSWKGELKAITKKFNIKKTNDS